VALICIYISSATQPQVGYAWIQYKLENDFGKESDAQNTLDSKPAPVVIGPGPAFYLIDDHHTLCALDYAGYSEVSVTLTVLCDKRNMTESEFWADMEVQNFAYLASHPADQPNSLPVRIDHSAIPASFSFISQLTTFSNDNWRALAGFSRKVESLPAALNVKNCETKNGDNKFCERAFYRGCGDGYQTSGLGVPFFEFRWSYFMNDGYLNTSLWDDTAAYEDFVSIYDQVSAEVSIDLEQINTEDWLSTAGYVVPLSRDCSGRMYQLPVEIFSSDLLLPGYYEGYIKLPEDPSCDVPKCV